VKTPQGKLSAPGLDRKGIARRIREIRGFDLNQGQFAKRLGISQAQLSKYERGQNIPTIEILLKLKAFSGKNIDWIVSGEL
jgi:transcriptional regulator with XRE-family HTH domain